VKRKSDNVNQARFNDTIETWYLDFTDKQVEILDYFLERKSIDWFAEKQDGVYHVKDFYDDWRLDYYIYKDGTIREELTAEQEFSSLAAFIAHQEEMGH